MKSALANSLWLAGCVPEYRRFCASLGHVQQTQEQVLFRILRDNADTEFGRLHGFAKIRSAREYQEAVPLREYEDLRQWIDRAAAGAANVLTRDPVRLFEPTSGSSGASKLIPYTASLEREFQNGIRAWIADLFLHDPALLAGPAYWSVSPVVDRARATSGGIPIGFADDTAYVGGWQQRLVESVMAVPGEVRLSADIDTFRYRTLLHLVRRRDLRLISVWNPSFLSLLVERLPEWGDRLAKELEPRRARELRTALSGAAVHAQLWPKLRLISCWADANASAGADALRRAFPQSRVQGKGLIATEAFVSFPLLRAEGSVMALRSHFLEFLPQGSTRPLLTHELEKGGQYAVVVTTGGGLYRYQLQDLVEVTGHVDGCPTIRFLGRQGLISDWFGEKLNEAHVARVMRDALDGVDRAFSLLACDTELASPGYVLYIETSAADADLCRAAERIDAGLCENFHYQYARRLGQLGPVRIFRVEHAADTYQQTGVQQGQRAGDIKPTALDRRNGWSGRFRGGFCVLRAEH